MKIKCEVFSRVVGYMRPIDHWNEGKQEEFRDRKTFDDYFTIKEFEQEVLNNDS